MNNFFPFFNFRWCGRQNNRPQCNQNSCSCDNCQTNEQTCGSASKQNNSCGCDNNQQSTYSCGNSLNNSCGCERKSAYCDNSNDCGCGEKSQNGCTFEQHNTTCNECETSCNQNDNANYTFYYKQSCDCENQRPQEPQHYSFTQQSCPCEYNNCPPKQPCKPCKCKCECEPQMISNKATVFNDQVSFESNECKTFICKSKQC